MYLCNHCVDYKRSARASALQTGPEHEQEGRSTGAVSGRHVLSYIGVCWCKFALVLPPLHRSLAARPC